MDAPPLSGTSWGTAKVMKNLYWESTVPKTLAPGNYLVRHELLALHQANTPQFYAECAQVCVRAYSNDAVLTLHRSKLQAVALHSLAVTSLRLFLVMPLKAIQALLLIRTTVPSLLTHALDPRSGLVDWWFYGSLGYGSLQ